MSEAPSPESGECEVGEDSLSTIDGESNVGSSVSKFASESEDESSSDSDEKEAEPKLEYERLSADLKAILKKDVASCLAVHSRFLILGSHWGVIHLLDAMGNSLPARQSQAHTITVNQVGAGFSLIAMIKYSPKGSHLKRSQEKDRKDYLHWADIYVIKSRFS